MAKDDDEYELAKEAESVLRKASDIVHGELKDSFRHAHASAEEILKFNSPQRKVTLEKGPPSRQKQ